MSSHNIVGQCRPSDRPLAVVREWSTSRRGGFRRWLSFLRLMWLGK